MSLCSRHIIMRMPSFLLLPSVDYGGAINRQVLYEFPPRAPWL